MIQEYFSMLDKEFDKAYKLAKEARAKGLDASNDVEIVPAPGIADRVEGLIGVSGLADLIKSKMDGRSRSELAFEMVKEICTNEKFDSYDKIKRILLAVRTGVAILTEGILVAPTEGIQDIAYYKNPDNSDYIALVYAGPIRSAGGTSVALSVALADYARKFFGISSYKATQEEIGRYIEEITLYNSEIARLQYMPSEDEMHVVLENCGVCIDGIASEKLEVSVHTNIQRRRADGRTVQLENRIRSGVPLVVSSIIQKAKSVLRETKKVGLDWSWLNNVIKVEKPTVQQEVTDVYEGFLEELVAGRPILAYPRHVGGFRLRYGRSRLTGIAAKGFSPASMVLLDEFIAIGTQLKVELPGKGCVAMPVDSIEGPFVRLKNGDALRINSAEEAYALKDNVDEILYVGDILITFGDFRKTNTQLQPSSYVEEFWQAELRSKGIELSYNEIRDMDFDTALSYSMKYGVPMHPRFLFEFQAITLAELSLLANAISSQLPNERLDSIESLALEYNKDVKSVLELLAVPHRIREGKMVIEGGYAKSLLISLGFVDDEMRVTNKLQRLLDAIEKASSALDAVNAVSPVKLPKRSTFIGARIGRPEKARERLMKPAPNALFPISSFGGRDRNVVAASAKQAEGFTKQEITVEIARYKCPVCKRIVGTPFCYDCGVPTYVEPDEAGKTYGEIDIDISKMLSGALKRLGLSQVPKLVKGVKGLINKDKIAESIEKGILRAMHDVYVFKDGTIRFDATDAPITHFYPKEMHVSVEKLRELGYDKDYLGNALTSEEQLVELRHQDVILNKRGAEYFVKVAQFVDDLLERYYGLPRFYNIHAPEDLIGHLVITLSPHTSCAVLNRVVGITEANVGFAHPYTISARRRNTDGDEDTTMLLLDALLNFSRRYLPASIGGTMDAPLLLTTHVFPEEVDDEVYSMELETSYPLEFYEKTNAQAMPGDVKLDIVESRLGREQAYASLGFTHESSINAIVSAPKRSKYVLLKSMQEKIDAEFKLIDMLYSIDKRDAAKRLILSHFIPDLMGNLHSFSKQQFRCAVCNAKYRRVPLTGKCTKCGGKLLLTISKGGIEKYLWVAIGLAEKYNIDVYTKQRLQLLKDEIEQVFGSVTLPKEENEAEREKKQEAAKPLQRQFDLSAFV